MKRLSMLLIILFSSVALFAQTKIIFDTDIDTDCDDAGALAILHALADNGEAEILATIVSTHYPYSAPCVEAINRYYGRPDIPIGAPKSNWSNTASRGSKYAKQISETHKTKLKNNDNAQDAVKLYRKILAKQQSNSVVILSVGYLTNLRDLLESKPDNISPLTGVDLVRQKVKRWICTGGTYPNDNNPAVRGNYTPDPLSAAIAVSNWPGPIWFSGEGDHLKTGSLLSETPADNPVRQIYEIYVGKGKTRPSWDLIATLFAVRPNADFWTFRSNGYYHFFNNGTYKWEKSPDKDHYVVEFNRKLKNKLRETLDQLMIQPPKSAIKKSKKNTASFISEIGDWNAKTNWLKNHVPIQKNNAEITDKKIAMINKANKCKIVSIGNPDLGAPWAKIILKHGGNLTVEEMNVYNPSFCLVCGGTLNISKYLKIGTGENNSTNCSEFFLTAGSLNMKNTAKTFIGYDQKGEMIVSWTGNLKANHLTIAEMPGSQGSVLNVIGGNLVVNNILLKCQNINVPSKIIIAGGNVQWYNSFIVNDILKIQNSSAKIIGKSKNNVGLTLNENASLNFDFGAKGIAPIILENSKISIDPSTKLRVSGTYYTRANGKAGEFLLIKHKGYAKEPLFKNVEITGFGNFIASIKYKKDSVILILKNKIKTINRVNQGIFMKYWELPVDFDGDKTVIFPPLTFMPDFDNSLIRTHPRFGEIVRKIDISKFWRNTNVFAQFKGLINIPQSGEYSFQIEYDHAATLTIDGKSIGEDKPGESHILLNLTSGMHKFEVGYYQNDSTNCKLEVYWKGPNFAKKEISEDDLFIPDPPESYSKFYAFGNIMPDEERVYNYCPSFLFDNNEGLYKFWSGGAGDGDFILYKEAPTIEKLQQCPTLNQLHPLHNDKFDEIHCCDPNVYIDEKGTFYLTYSGCSDGKPLGKATRIGMAVSDDKGRSWTRLHNGVHIIGPKKPEGKYGTGQSAVVRANDGFYYMIYTDADAAHKGQWLAVVKCSDPAFPKGEFTLAKKDLHYGASVDLAYDSKKDQFIIVSDVSSDPDKTYPYARVRLAYFDKNWNELRVIYLKADTSWSFGEGITFLTDINKNPLEYSYHENKSYVFAAATQSYEKDTRLWAEWVEGDTRYLIFEVPEGADKKLSE